MDKNEELLPYYEKAKDVLNYNHETGLITWVKPRYKSILGRVAGYYNDRGYNILTINIDGNKKRISAHRFVWFYFYGELPSEIDHIDGNTSNNKIENLRSCTRQQNSSNLGFYSTNTSGYKGVTWHKGANKWASSITFKNKKIYLGLFDCPKKASEAYQEKARELRGCFHRNQ